MTTNQMVAAFDMVIKYGVDNPTAEQIAAHQRKQRKIANLKKLHGELVETLRSGVFSSADTLKTAVDSF